MSNYSIFNICDQQFHLYPEKAIYWVDGEALLIADLHIGKVMHFRKNGIAIPEKAKEGNWERLSYLIAACAPRRVIILGDLFHSHMNTEWSELLTFIGSYADIPWILVQGNHDILSNEDYKGANLELLEEELIEGPFIFTHKPIPEYQGPLYNIHGHIHPGIRLSGHARQSMRLPCFYFGEHQGILPAFGAFTGLATQAYMETAAIYVIADDSVVKIE